MKRRVIPQFDLPSMEQVFNLRIETTTDGERVQRKRDWRKCGHRDNQSAFGRLSWRPATARGLDGWPAGEKI